MRKCFKFFFMAVASLFLIFVFDSNSLEATEYFYESGNVSREYEKVKVYSFNYDYITKFTATSNYHNGQKVVDGGKNLEDVNFYSGSRITISYDHYDNFFPWVADADSFQIFKYNESRENFSTLYKSFNDSTGEYVLDGEVDKEGIYKFAYVLDNEVKYVDYVYLCKNFQKMSIDFGNRYDNVSPAKKITFDLVMEDPYNLNKNKYYYAFGEDIQNLNFKEITNMFTSAELGMEDYKTLSKTITVNIDSNITGNKRLFVKCVRYSDEYEQIVYSKVVNIIDKIQGVVSIVDDNGNKLSGDQFYKNGETIKFFVELNLPVQYTNAAYFLHGRKASFSIPDSTSEVTSFSFNYVISDSDENRISLILKTRDKDLFYVIYSGAEIKTDLSYNFSVIKDEKAPGITLNTTDDNKQIKSTQRVEIVVKDTYLSRVYYYVKACDNIIKDRCADLFDDSKAITIDDAYSASGEYRVQKNVDYTDGKFNEKALAIFVKAIDKAGNETTEVFYNPTEYVIDNVIYEEGIDPIVYKNIDDGASFSIVNDEGLKIKKVLYSIQDEEAEECILENGEFTCASFSGFAFNFKIRVYIEDIYGNGEIYSAQLKHYPVKEDTLINGYKFVQNNVSEDSDYEFSTDIYNTTYDETKRIFFNEAALNKISELLGLNVIEFSNKNISLLLNVDGEEITIDDNITDELYFPTLLEVYDKLIGKEKYAKCSISGNVCDVETFILYSYKVMDKYSQTRKIKVVMKDNTNKYIVEDFDGNIKVGVNGEFVDYSFEYVNNLNTKLEKDSVSENVKIFFNGIEVEKVDTSKIGTYSITRTFVSAGVGSYPLSYNVVVVDEIAPTIKLKNSKDYVMRVGKPLEKIEDWVIASDNYDTNLKIKYSIEPEVDVNTPGSYVVSIWAVDSSGNESNVVTRTIVVKRAEISKSTYFILIGIIVAAAAIITLFVFAEKRKQKRLG